jgi:hypothetical protein
MMKPAPVKLRERTKGWKEGADEVSMARFAFVLTGHVAAIAVFQTIVWLAG